MKSIKAFVYLDKHKMYSISSQIFEGLTEYIVNYSIERNEDRHGTENEEGRILGHILGKELGTESRRFLHDYSYSVFEKKLIGDSQVLELNNSNLGTYMPKIKNHSFLKITGRAVFKDVKLMVHTMESFNEMGKALAYVTTQNEFLRHEQGEEELNKGKRTRNSSSAAKARTRNMKEKEIEIIAGKLGLQIDPEFLKRMAYLLKYGYKDQLEFQIPLTSTELEMRELIFSAILNRSYLEEDEETLIKRYSRNTEKELTMFGIVTQSENVSGKEESENEQKPTELKLALMELNNQISAIEEKYTGKLANEVIVDPIAIYRELHNT